MRYKKISKPIDQVGQELNVDAVVEGTVERAGNRVRIRVQLIQAASGRHLWAQSYDRELRDTLVLQSEAAGDIVREIRSRLTPLQQQRLAAAPQVNPTAYEAYLKGLYFSNKRSAQNFVRAIDYFQQAIAADPSYGAAYSGLSNALVGQMFVGTPANEVRERATLAALKLCGCRKRIGSARLSWKGLSKEAVSIMCGPTRASANCYGTSIYSSESGISSERCMERSCDLTRVVVATSHRHPS